MISRHRANIKKKGLSAWATLRPSRHFGRETPSPAPRCLTYLCFCVSKWPIWAMPRDSQFGTCAAGTKCAELQLSGFCITFLGLGPAPSASISSGRRCAFWQPRRPSPGCAQGQRSTGRISRFSIFRGGVEGTFCSFGCNVIGLFEPPASTLTPAPSAWA